MIKYILNTVRSFFSSNDTKNIVEQDSNEELGDHITLCLTKENEPYIKILITDEGDINSIAKFADMLDSLNNGLYFSSIINTLQEIGMNNPEVRDKVKDIIYCWEHMHRKRNSKTFHKNSPVIKPTDFSKKE